MNKSYAEIATGLQGVEHYVGHDKHQNGIINSSCDRVYMAGWQNNWASATYTNGKGVDCLSASGFFTDQATIDRCMHDDRLNTNELDAALQTKLSDYSTSLYDSDGNRIQGDFQAHSHVSAYDIDHGRLEELKSENPGLYNRLTNPDGLSPDGGGIKAAYGQAEANPQHGIGGGNQYYMDPQTFKDALDAGVFNYNPDASFSTDGSTGRGIDREDISPEKYGDYNGGEYDRKLYAAKKDDEEKMDALAVERANTGQSEAEQINSQSVKENPDLPYIANPDPAYGYGVDKGNEDNESDGVEASSSSSEGENLSAGEYTGKRENLGEGEDSSKGESGDDDMPNTAADGNDGEDDADDISNTSADGSDGEDDSDDMSNTAADGSESPNELEDDGIKNVAPESENGREHESDEMPNTANGNADTGEREDSEAGGPDEGPLME